MLPSEIPEVQEYYYLKRLLQAQVDMQFMDLRSMLLLPRKEIGLEGGCNLAATAILFNIIAGFSVCLFESGEDALRNRGDRSRRFREIIRQYYPWENEPVEKNQFVNILYDSARNPLTHSLGLDTPPSQTIGKQVVLQKYALTMPQILELEDSQKRPAWLAPTLIGVHELAHGSVEVVISVPTLYWGVNRMIRNLFSNPVNNVAANSFSEAFSPQWDKYMKDEGSGVDTMVVEENSKNDI